MTILIKEEASGNIIDIIYPEMEAEGVIMGTPDDGGIEVNFIDEMTGREVSVFLSEKVFDGIAAYYAVRGDEDNASKVCHITEPHRPYPPLPVVEPDDTQSPYPF